MADKPEDIELISGSPLQRDQIDLNRALTDGNASRTTQSSIALNQVNQAKEKQQKENEYTDFLLYLLENDVQYWQAYERLKQTLIHAQGAVDQAMISIDQRLTEADRLLRDFDARAATLDDGTKVFRSSADGSIRDENGIEIPAAQAATIHIPDDAPSWEEYRAVRDQIDLLNKNIAELNHYQLEVLDHAKRRLNDKNDLPDKEELDALNKRVQEEFPTDVRKMLGADIFPDASRPTGFAGAAEKFESDNGKKLSPIDLGEAFGSVNVNAPDDTVLPGLATPETSLPKPV